MKPADLIADLFCFAGEMPRRLRSVRGAGRFVVFTFADQSTVNATRRSHNRRSPNAVIAMQQRPSEAVRLTQEWDKTLCKSGTVDHQRITFKNRYGITLAADLYLPKNRAGGRVPALAVSSPFGAVKEQVSRSAHRSAVRHQRPIQPAISESSSIAVFTPCLLLRSISTTV